MSFGLIVLDIDAALVEASGLDSGLAIGIGSVTVAAGITFFFPSAVDTFSFGVCFEDGGTDDIDAALVEASGLDSGLSIGIGSVTVAADVIFFFSSAVDTFSVGLCFEDAGTDDIDVTGLEDFALAVFGLVPLGSRPVPDMIGQFEFIEEIQVTESKLCE